MDYLQYLLWDTQTTSPLLSVLNLVINGLPSILFVKEFKNVSLEVLNLVINGLPSIQKLSKEQRRTLVWAAVLNLVINGLPSIRSFS